jgi:hypothetical protein
MGPLQMGWGANIRFVNMLIRQPDILSKNKRAFSEIFFEKSKETFLS